MKRLLWFFTTLFLFAGVAAAQQSKLSKSSSGYTREKVSIPGYIQVSKNSPDSKNGRSINFDSGTKDGSEVSVGRQNGFGSNVKYKDVNILNGWYSKRNELIIRNESIDFKYVEIIDTAVYVPLRTVRYIETPRTLFITYSSNSNTHVTLSQYNSESQRYVQINSVPLPNTTLKTVEINIAELEENTLLAIEFLKTGIGTFKIFSLNF